MAQINYEIEKFQGDKDGNFYTITLTGDTFAAKEIIKSLGDFQFSNPVGHEKAWRSTKVFFESKLAQEKESLKAIVNKMYSALKAAGYTVVRQ